MRSVEPEHDPEIAELLREGREALAERPTAAQLRAELVVGGAFAMAAAALALTAPDAWSLEALPTAALIVAYAVASRVRFELAQGGTDASLLILVPMLFALDPSLVPLLVVGGYALALAPRVLAGREQPLDLAFAPANAWHAVGPAAVIAFATDPGGPRWEDWPWFGIALGGMLACDTLSGLAREALGRGVRPELQLRLLLRVWALDAALAPVGLLAAFAMAGGTYGFLLLLPLFTVLAALGRERGERLTHALSLAEARSALLETELAAARGREEALAAVSHGLQTPLASVIGLARLLDERGDALTAERRTAAARQVHIEALALRHRVRQVLDYPRLRAGRPLALRPTRCDLARVVRRAADAAQVSELVVQGADAAPELTVDEVRVEQVVTALLDNAGRHGAGPVELDVEVGAHSVAITVSDHGPGVPEHQRPTLFDDPDPQRGRDEAAGTGIGLYVAAGIARALGGELRAEFPAQGGSRFTFALPRAATDAT